VVKRQHLDARVIGVTESDCIMNSPQQLDTFGWDRLRHGGLLLDPPRLRRIEEQPAPAPLTPWQERELRRRAGLVQTGTEKPADFVAFVLEEICGFDHHTGSWHRGSNLGTEWTRRGVAGEAIRPRMLWQGGAAARLPVFLDDEKRIGIGRGRRSASQVLQWLRAGSERLALLTNGRQWRLIFAGLDFDAWCEWDVDLWFEEGDVTPQVTALRTLLSWRLWTPPEPKADPPLLQAILDSRKGQAELSAELGERVRAAVELLVDVHGEVLKERCPDVAPADIYRAAVRVVMRMVVVMFAESRELLPRDNALYHSAYGLGGLLEELEKIAARGGNRLGRSWNAWPRVLSLFRLVHGGSHHPSLPVPRYGGELFAPGDADSTEGLSRALAVFETACFDGERMSDRDVHRMLERITRTRVRVRQGHGSTWVGAPVDFSDLSSEYIGILYEGLLDFELKTAPAGDPIIFLAIGNQPALPLSRLETMDDKAIANLLEKLKDTSRKSDDEEEAGDEPEEAEEAPAEASGDAEAPDDEAEPALEGDESEDDVATDDTRHVTRSRAEQWARRAVDVGKLVRRPTGRRSTPEGQLRYEDDVGRKARQLVTRVVLPGEWYLVRWGGTRKGSGTFYTRPALAVPTVQRTLRPLAYDPPLGDDGSPDRFAPAPSWTPKTPEAILALKVCDPACGSGTFPVAALRFLTDALYAALHEHGRIGRDGDKAVVRLLEGTSPHGPVPEERLGHELLPSEPDSELFEPRLKAVLRRHVVERCIYGVDLDPLAVELCRLALWIETMDRSLPFSFLDHKIRAGNSLVGAWFDTFEHYPVMAWKNREGGDKNHTNGIHFQKDARGKAIKTFVKDRLTPDLQRFLGARTLDLFSNTVESVAGRVHDEALAILQRMHALPVHDAAERARIYREELLAPPSYRALRNAMDRWCACWFWPADRLDDAPLPTEFAKPRAETTQVASQVAAEKRFFHWELEFPDVFRAAGSGFDAILGNPPWDIAKPNSKEYFSNVDPLYRSYGKQEALGFQKQYFADKTIENSWLEYSADFRAQSNYVSHAAAPFGDPEGAGKTQERFSIARGNENERLHAAWRALRRQAGFADPRHPFRHQGAADLNLYKLFLEQSHALLRDGGRLGFIVPSGLYSDHGTGALRNLFLEQCSWEWLFGFENREGIFAIHRSFKFNPVIVQKGGATEAIQTAFMRRRLEDWDRAEALATPYSRAQVEQFSPRSRAILEITSRDDVGLATRIFRRSLPAADTGLAERRVRFAKGDFDMVSGSRHFQARDVGSSPDELGFYASPSGELLLPLYEGRMIGQFESSQKGWVRGRGRSAVWRNITPSEGDIEPQWLVPASTFESSGRGLPSPRVGFIRVTSNTNTRTTYATVLPPFPTGFTACQLQPHSMTWMGALELAVTMNSVVFDYVARRRVCGLDIAWFHLQELPIPCSDLIGTPAVIRLAASLCFTAPALATGLWDLRSRGVLHDEFRLALTPAERLRSRCILDAVAAAAYGIEDSDLRKILRGCDRPKAVPPSVVDEIEESKGFWRVDFDDHPEHRHTVLSLVARCELANLVRQCDDVNEAIDRFVGVGDGEGWLLPETLRLADYGLGVDDRAKTHQPVAEILGPRWTVEQTSTAPVAFWNRVEARAELLRGRQVSLARWGGIEDEQSEDDPDVVRAIPTLG
jgi:hypothetical protein